MCTCISAGAGGVREVFWSDCERPAWWRQLANESAGVFSDAQACQPGQGEAALRITLLKLSRRYRSVDTLLYLSMSQ